MEKNQNQSVNDTENIPNGDDSPVIPPKDVFCTNEVRSCAELCRMVTEKNLNTQPNYQRRVVWTNPDRTRFIDSLSKRLPIPSLCISVSNEKYDVIDGQQRIDAIVTFLSHKDEQPDTDWKLSSLEDVDANLSNKRVSEIKKNNPALYERIRNTMLPVTLVYCDYSKKNHLEYIYKIFYRLNSFGLPLNNQEIRNCIYFGTFNDLIKKLDTLEIWKLVFPEVAAHNRLIGQERILMFFAFYDNFSSYNGRLTTFLNKYMIDNKSINQDQAFEKRTLFENTLNIASKIKYSKQSKVVTDAVLYGISKNIIFLKDKNSAELTLMYEKLIASEEFNTEALSGGIWKKEPTINRLNKAANIFSC